MVEVEISDGRKLDVPYKTVEDLDAIGENVLYHLHTGVMGLSEEILPADDIIVAAFVIRELHEKYDELDAKLDKCIDDYGELADRYNQLVGGFNVVVATNRMFYAEIDRLRAELGRPSLNEQPMDLMEHRADWDDGYSEMKESGEEATEPRQEEAADAAEQLNTGEVEASPEHELSVESVSADV